METKGVTLNTGDGAGNPDHRSACENASQGCSGTYNAFIAKNGGNVSLIEKLLLTPGLLRAALPNRMLFLSEAVLQTVKNISIRSNMSHYMMYLKKSVINHKYVSLYVH